MEIDPINIDREKGMWNIYDYKAHRDNPMFLIIATIIILFYYIVFSHLGGVNLDYGNQVNNPAITIIEVIMWGVFIFLLLVNGMQYFFDVNVNTGIQNLFSPTPKLDLTVTQEKNEVDIVPEIQIEKQVFHIPDSRYNYEEAKAVCAAYDSNLATYDQIEDSYKDNAEWCSYGWSKGQNVYYPTQKSTYDKLQRIPEHENDCGRPGINGGYIDNKNAKFGVNCYGYKPAITDEEQKLMANSTFFPKTKKDLDFDNKVDNYRKNLKNILIAPHSKNRWSVI
jgi:hypothetical protein